MWPIVPLQEGEYENESFIHSTRQEVAFLEGCSENKGCGNLREDFYTRFIPSFLSWGCDVVDIKDWRGDKDEN